MAKKAKGRAGNEGRKKKTSALAGYRRKRDFTKTPEPGPAVPKKSAGSGAEKARAFCVQKHLASHLHYDFRLEHHGVLLSWAVPKGPSLKTSDKRLAMRVEDHPYDYKDFEGVIPSGYGAGVVMLWDEGTWSPEPGFENVAAALARGELKFTLQGVKLKGSWVLVRAGEKTPGGERERWLLMKHKDRWAGDVDIATFAPDSVRSNHDFAAIIKSNPDLWESHKPADADLQKIVDKVMALKESAPAAGETKRRKGRARSK